MSRKTAIIIGAGPAGLTAAYELLIQSDIKPLVLERTQHIGGISTTINYKGNRMDIGGHRFFSKSDRVMEWWLRMLPLQETTDSNLVIAYHNQVREVNTCCNKQYRESSNSAMMLRPRKSRIYFQKQFFDYPLKLTAETITKLGILKTFRIAVSYCHSLLFPLKPERSLEDFFINRFGRELYETFFQSYTEKVWGIRCTEISAEWGAQRIKGLSILEAVRHCLKQLFTKKDHDLKQKNTETSLIEQFLYPKYGPGQMWEEVARKVVALGGEIMTGCEVDKLQMSGNHVKSVDAFFIEGERKSFQADYVFSTMPVKDLVRSLSTPVPAAVRDISEGLLYRDFITIGLLLERLKVPDGSKDGNGTISDNWIYIQEPDVRVGRMQIFNNWSPYLVKDQTKFWVGLEYFCNEKDSLWRMTDEELIELATKEMQQMGFIVKDDVIDATVVRVPKTYPAYFGTYNRFGELRAYLDQLENLFLIGRNGMHKYNNQDHSMLTAMAAVGNIVAGIKDKDNIWAVNTDDEYHESKAS